MERVSKQAVITMLAGAGEQLSVIYSSPHNGRILEKRRSVDADELAKEITERFDKERMRGFDFECRLPDSGKTIVGNHAGELYLC